MLRNLFPIAGWRGANPPVHRRHGVKGFDRVRTPHLSLAMSAIAFWLAINTPTRSTALADSEGPHVTTVEIVSSPAVGDTYGLSECIDIALTFDTKVRVLGSPAIGIWVGTRWYGAAYRTGSGTNKLIFSHRVQWEDVDNDGISVFPGQASRADGASDGLTRGFANGSIVAADTGAGAHPEFAGIHAAAGHKVDWNNVVQVAGVSIISRPAVGDTYRAGEALEVQLSYAEDIVVEGPVGVSIYVGDEGSSWRGAWYVRGSGTDTLVFRYVVKRTDVDANGLSVSSGWRGSGYIGVGGIRSAATGQYSSRSYPGTRNADDHKVLGSEDLVAPRITSLSVATRPAAVDYGAGDRIAVEVAFDEPVLVTGSPELELDFDGTPRTADYVASPRSRALDSIHSGASDTLTFVYTVAEGDHDPDGFAIAENKLSLASGTIRNLVGSDAILDHDSVPEQPSQCVDARNLPPVFGEPGGVERSVDENATRGTTVGSPISATDREGAALTYSVSRDEWNAFSIDESTGQVSNRYKLNHEHRATHSLQVTASDGVHEVSTEVIVRVNDLDEPGRVSFWEPESVCLPVLHAILSDPDTDRSGFNLSWERSDNGVDGWALIGQIEATSSSYSALASDSGKFIRATVTYSDKFGAGKTAQRVQALGEFAPPQAGCESMAMGRVNRSTVTR